MRISHGLCLVVCVIGTACGESAGTSDGDPGVDPTWTVEVQRTHEGNGTVVSTVGGIASRPTCAAQVPDWPVMVLTAVPDAGAVFAGWSGPCSDAATTCTFTVGGELTV